MVFREARPNEADALFREGYRVWSRGRTYEQYCAENRKEDRHGTRYVLEADGDIVSSLILLRLKPFGKACGIGSVVTHEGHEGKGCATALLRGAIAAAEREFAVIFLYSDIEPAFYERFGFRALPARLQKKKGSVCMARCKEDIWNGLMSGDADSIPGYF
jgi:predicted N-acetyltransferase YhbS